MTTRPGNSAPNSAMFGRQTFVPAAEPLAPVQISSDFNQHHAGLENYAPGQAPKGLGALHSFLVETSDQLGKLNHLRANPDPSHPEAAHVLKVNDLGGKTIARLAVSYDRAAAGIRDAIANYDAELTQAGRLIPTSQAAELRSIIRALPEAERYSVLLAAIADGQTDIVSAALSAPGLASGLSDKSLAALRDHHLLKAAPLLLEQRRQAQRAQAKLGQAFDTLLMQADEYTAKSRAEIIKAQKADSDKHSAALGASHWGS
jgi:hypothetical protein